MYKTFVGHCGNNMKVFVYYNLHKDCWSVKALDGKRAGYVVAHRTKLELRDAKFKVSEAGRQRVLREKRKNVHAGVVGEWEPFKQEYDTLVSYNPYKNGHFYRKADDTAIYEAGVVAFKDKRVTCK